MEDFDIYMIAKVRLDRLRENPTLYDHVKLEVLMEYQKIFRNPDEVLRAYVYSYSLWLKQEQERTEWVDYIY